MRVPPIVAALVAVLALSGCTGSGTGGSPTSSAPTSPSTSTPPKEPKPRVTGFTSAWAWTSPVARSEAALNKTSDLAQDGTTAVVVTSFGDSDAKIDKTTKALVTGLDVATGRQLWRHSYPGTATSVQLSSGIALLTMLTSGNAFSGHTVLIALDATSGAERWRFQHDFTSPEEDVAPPLVDGSVYLNVVEKGTYLTAVDVQTGKQARAIKIDTYAAPVPGGDLVLLDSGTSFEAYPADLSKIAWQTEIDEKEGYREFVIGDTAVRVDGGKHTVYGHDLATGRLKWTTVATIADPYAFYWVTAGYVAVSSYGLAEVIDPATGKIVWQTYQQGAPRIASSATADDNLLACGGSLVSVDAPTGRLYGHTTLPDAGFKDDCVLQPVAAKNTVLVASASTVAAYRTTVADDPATTSGDGTGAWGPVDPAKCDVDADSVRSALTAVFPGTWRISVAGTDNGVCIWVQKALSVTIRPKTATEAKQYLDPSNDEGGCADAGASSGSLHRVDVSGTGLPAGSGACYQTGLEFGKTKASDPIAGVTRLPDGQWASFFYFVGHDKALSTHQPARAKALLLRLAR